jgi:hypothetical protein
MALDALKVLDPITTTPSQKFTDSNAMPVTTPKNPAIQYFMFTPIWR